MAVCVDGAGGASVGVGFGTRSVGASSAVRSVGARAPPAGASFGGPGSACGGASAGAYRPTCRRINQKQKHGEIASSSVYRKEGASYIRDSAATRIARWV